MSVREDCHWFDFELQLHHVQDAWETVTEKKEEQFYSYDCELDSKVEKKVNTQLIVSGPMIDVYLKELGSQILHKLYREKTTGIVQTNSLLIPWQVWVNIMRLIKLYGGKISAEAKKSSKEKVFTSSLSDSCCHKVWHIKRCNKNFLSRRRFIKDITGLYVYNGCSNVVISGKTPLILTYKTKTQKVTCTYYIQSYDKDAVAIDAALQRKLNAP